MEEKIELQPVMTVKKDLAPVPFKTLFRYATAGDIMMMIAGAISAIAAGAAFPLTTVVFGELIDVFSKWEAQKNVQFSGVKITADELTGKVATNTVFFLYLALGTFVLTYVYMGTFIWSAERQTHKIRSKYLEAVLRQNVSFFDDEGAGETSVRITTDTLLIQDGMGEKIPLALNQFSTFLSGFVIAFTKSWQLTLVLMCAFPFIAISGGVMGLLNGRFQTRILALYSVAGGFAEESISAIRTVVAFGAQNKMSKRYNESLAEARNEGIKKSISTGVGLGSLFFFVYCCYSLAFYFGAKLLASNTITPGSVVNVFFAVLIGAFALGQIAPDLQAFSYARSAGAKIFYTIDRVPEIDPYTSNGYIIEPLQLKGELELKSVTFSYPSRPNIKVLKDVSLTVPAGSTVALVGQSGSGKSTIIQLLERFYDPDSGVVEMDGYPIKNLNLGWFRRQVGIVSQEPTLFEGTVADNVGHGLIGSLWENESDQVRKKMIEEACIKANAHDFIMKLPQGYDTPVGERGQLLSGGQKQRICIARAIIKNPKILLLDEATSALDTTSERVVQDALNKASEGRTTLVIAHRLSTIKDADMIIVMIDGKIIESGTHNSLLDDKNSFYSRLVEAQALASKKEDMTQEDSNAEEKSPDLIASPSGELEFKSSRSKLSLSSSNHLIESATGEKLNTWRIVREIAILNLPELKYTIPALFASIVSGMVIPFFALVFGTLVQVFSYQGEKLETESNFWALMFLILAIVILTSSFFQYAFFGLSAEYLTERIRKMVFLAILKQDVAFFDDENHATGILTARLSTDAQKIQGLTGVSLGTILQISSTLIGGLVIALIYGWRLALVGMAMLPFLILAGAFRLKVLTYFAEKSKLAYERSAQLACESVAAIKTVQSLTRERDVHAKYMQLLANPLKDGFKNAWTNTLLYALSQSTNFMVNALVFWYGGRLIVEYTIDLKSFFTVFMAIIFGSMSAGRIFAAAPDFAKAVEAGGNVLNLLWSKPRIDPTIKSGHDIEKLSGSLEFRNVKFSYPTRPHVKVLQGLNIKVNPGQFIAFVGPSGCGKSTTVGLIERFYDPISGTILVDGKDISSLSISSYRSHLGLVSQEPNLFDLSVKENIIFGCDSIPSQEEIEKAAKKANIHDFIIGLPNGYDTTLGVKGGQLSGGQKQRIAIARALVRNPKILLLDEATSALDAESEKVVQAALDEAAKGRTTIAIAHRLATIQNADIIYVFKDGEIAESGNHQELLQLNGLYHELVVQQDVKKS